MDRLAEIFVTRFGVSADRIDQAHKMQVEKGGSLGDLLVAHKVVDETTLAKALAELYGLPFIEHIPTHVPGDLLAELPISYAQQHSLMPVALEDGCVKVVMGDPTREQALEDLRLLYGARISAVVAPRGKVQDTINMVYAAVKDVNAQLGEGTLGEYQNEEDEFTDITDLVGDDSSDEPIIKFVNNLLFRAIKERASDVHIEPMEKDVSVRYRVDGVMYEVLRVPKAAQARVTSRVKIMGNLNIAEKRVPQDGRIRIKIAGRDIDIRLSTLPTSHGERVVMRLLDRSNILLDITDLGFDGRKLKEFNQLIHQPHGILLVTGPTGSGKTTTLYAALSKLNTPEKNIITIEDPVEYQLQGIGQIHVNPKINMTFAAGLRSILRQDPDIIMIGEIRDFETAEIAVQASLTGHLVLSTIHTNDASSSVTRMVDMGVEPFLVGSSVIGILAQRLVRKLCAECRAPYPVDAATLKELGVRVDRIGDMPQYFYHPVGCPHCNGRGYAGRNAIFELLMVDDDIRILILRNETATPIKKMAMSKGMLTLREDGARKIFEGLCSVEEVVRVTQDEILLESE